MDPTYWKSPWHRVLVGLGLFLLVAGVWLIISLLFDELDSPYMIGLGLGLACVYGVIPVSPRSFGRPAARWLLIIGSLAFIVLLLLGEANTNPGAGLALGLASGGLMYEITFRKEDKKTS